MSRLTWDGTAEPVSRDQILRREREQGNIHFPYSADHEQDWQPYPVIYTLATCVTIHALQSNRGNTIIISGRDPPLCCRHVGTISILGFLL